MKKISISEAKGMIGQIIPMMEVKLGKLWERRTGDGQHGPYSFQNGTIEDETGVMDVTFANHEPMEEFQGELLRLSSKQTKNGLLGLKVEQKEYKGKISILLKVTGVASISSISETSEETSPAPTPSRQTQKSVSKGNDPRHRIMQLANLYDLCASAAEFLAEKNKLSSDLRKDIATTLFIEGCREGLANSMPDNRPIEKKETPSNGDDLPESIDELEDEPPF